MKAGGYIIFNQPSPKSLAWAIVGPTSRRRLIHDRSPSHARNTSPSTSSECLQIGRILRHQANGLRKITGVAIEVLVKEPSPKSLLHDDGQTRTSIRRRARLRSTGGSAIFAQFSIDHQASKALSNYTIAALYNCWLTSSVKDTFSRYA
jgi:hypothetical protein